MSSVTSTSTTYWSSPTTLDSGTTSSGTDSLSDVETFLQLLATELQNQDPTDPVSNTEYVSQLAQFNSLQQLASMNQTLSSYQAYALIGAEVSYTATDSSGNTVSGSGVVDSVITNDNTIYLSVDGSLVQLSSVTQVSAATSDTTSA